MGPLSFVDSAQTDIRSLPNGSLKDIKILNLASVLNFIESPVMGQLMGDDSEDVAMLDDGARRIGTWQRAPVVAVEYIDLQDNKYYNSRTYNSPSLRYKDYNISTKQSWSNGKVESIQRKALIHDRGSKSYDQNWYQKRHIEESHQNVATDGMRDLGDVETRNNTTNSPGVRNSRQQLQMDIGGNGAEVQLNAPSSDCQWDPKKHVEASTSDTRTESPTLPRKRPHMSMTVGFQESDSTSESSAAKSPKRRLTSLLPLRRVQVHNEIANKGPDVNADSASSHAPQKERDDQARPSNAPKMGFAALETLAKPRPAPFGTLKIDTSLLREEEDQLFVSASDDDGQEGDSLCSQKPNIPGQNSYQTQQKDIANPGPQWARQIARHTQKLSRKYHATTRASNERESRRLARELVATEACGVFSESHVPAGCSPAQHIPTPAQLRTTRNMTCIICDSKFAKREYVRNHFPKCVQKNGNPNRHFWFDHPSIRNKDDIIFPNQNDTTVQTKNDSTVRNRNDTTIHNPNDVTVLNKNDTQSKILNDGFGPFSKKTDDEPTIDPASSLPRLQADPATAVEHRTTGGKGISDATIASWLATQSGDEDIGDEDDFNAKNEMETSDSAWQYHVTRQEIHTADLGLGDPIERKFGPYWTLGEANAKAEEEIQIRDISPPPGPHPRGWNLQFRHDENGMDSHTVEVQGTTISTTVTRTLVPRAELAKRRMPASAFITPPTIYTILSVSIHNTTMDVDIKPHGHYALRTKANERAGELWLELFADMEATGAVKKYDLEREIRKEIRELAEMEGLLFDRIVGADAEEGAVGRVWVVEEVVKGPRN